MLTNSQNNEIERIYDERRRVAREKQLARSNELREKYPVIAEIDDKIVENSLKAGRMAIMRNDDSALEELKYVNEQLVENRREFLESVGIPRNYLEDVYQCKKCKDTGIIDGKRCKCYYRTIIDTFYMTDARRELLEKQNFQNFNEELYSKENLVLGTRKTEYELACENLGKALNFVDDFDMEYANLFIAGRVGTGKTFLANCIAKNLMDKGKTVLYVAATEFKQLVSDASYGDWSTKKDAQERKEIIFDADCVIIDDLGTEVVNSLMQSELYALIERRDLFKKATVITSNLDMEGIRKVYSDRISSRIKNNYLCLYMPGDDNRGKQM